MALISIGEVCEGVRLGLWRMDEEPDALLLRFPHLRLLDCPYKHAARRKEFFAVRALLLAMTGDPTLCIDHTENGRPVIVGDGKSPTADKGWQLSISHTRGFAALILSKEGGAELGKRDAQQRAVSVGVDIEYRSDRVAKIASHYIRPDEMGADCKSPTADGQRLTTEQMLVLWCAKETLYKLHSPDRLDYFEMRAATPPVGDVLMLENMKRGQQVKVHVISAPEYVLTWAVD